MSKPSNNTKSFRCFEWNFKNVDDIENLCLPKSAHLNSKKQSSKTFQKLKQMNYEQKDVEDKFRCMNDKKFKFNPTTFSVDCQHNASLVHRNLLNLSGCDEIILNNPRYFDSLYDRMKFKNDFKVSQQEISRMKKEKHRLLLEKLNFGSSSKALFSFEPDIFKNRKFYNDTCRNSTKDCEDFAYQYKKKSCDSSLSECERFDYNPLDYSIRKLDYLDEENSMRCIYEKAAQFIKDKLMAPPVEKIKTMNFPPELGVPKVIETREVVSEIKKVISRKDTDRVPKFESIVKSVDFTTCGCKRKK